MIETGRSEKPSSEVQFASEAEQRQDLWTVLAEPQNMEQFSLSWLALLASMDASCRKLLLVGLSPENIYRPLAFWPEDGDPPEELTEVVEQVIEETCGLVLDLDGVDGKRFAVAYPVFVDDALRFVVAAEIFAGDEATIAASMEQLQWSSSWLEAVTRRSQAKETHWQLERMSMATDLLAQVLDEETFDDAAMSLVTELALQMDCDRVSMGLKEGERITVQALSHSAQFGEKMNLIRAIGAAMDEAVLQNRDLVYPQEGVEGATILRDHEHLCNTFGSRAVLTVPLFNGASYYGAITLERTTGNFFAEEEISVCRELAALAGAALQQKRINDRPLIVKVKDAASVQLKRMFGPKYLGRKLLAVTAVVLLLCCIFIDGDYRLSADTVIEGAVQRKVVAPFDGYIAETGARAGDVVDEGSLLCLLDDRDFRLERMNWLSQKSQFEKQRQDALAKHDRAQVNILSAQIEQAKAQLELIGSKLERTRLISPYRGLVTSGDLTQRLGGSVQQGEKLFEVAPLDVYRVILKVDERRIADVQVNQPGELILTSLPDETFLIEVSKLTPITTAEEGLNFFRVEARLIGEHEGLRPGMEGVGKVMVDRRNLFGIWTRDLREWLTLWVWSWWP